MQKDSKEFLYKLLKTPSPTGYEQKIQRVVRSRMESVSDKIELDYHGNLTCILNPEAKLKVMLAGHCDQIGLMVTHISDKGYVYFQPLGGIDTGVLEGAIVTVHSEAGPVQGVIGRKPIHLQKPEERGKSGNDINLLWIDIGAKDKKEAEQKIEIGDPITFNLGITELSKDLISSPGMDDKVGLFVAMETLRICAKKRAKLKVGLYAVSTVQEEVGLRGAMTAAHRINPDVGIAIDVTPANDNPGTSPDRTVPCSLGSGPCIARGPNINPVVEKRLREAAKKAKVKYQLEPNSRPLGNDANAIQVSQAGVAAGSLEIPNRYMHTPVEVCSLRDIEDAAKLLAEFVLNISERTDFRPR